MRSALSLVEASWACDVRTYITREEEEKDETTPDPVYTQIPIPCEPASEWYPRCAGGNGILHLRPQTTRLMFLLPCA